MNQSKHLKDGVIFLLIYLAAIAVSIFVPLIILPALLFFPLPFAIYAYRYEWPTTISFTLIVALVTTLIYADLGILITGLAAATGLLIGWSMRTQKRPFEVWTRATLGATIGFLLIFVYIQVFFQINWEQEVLRFTQETITLSEQMFGSVGLEALTEQQQQLLETQMVGFIQLIPALILIAAGVYGCIAQWISYKMVNRLHTEQYGFPPFRTLRFPTAIIWVYLLAIIVTFFQGAEPSTMATAAQNVLTVIGALLVVQGFSFLFYLVHMRNLPKALPIIAIILTVMFPVIFIFIMRLFGVVDIGFDVRKQMSDKK